MILDVRESILRLWKEKYKDKIETGWYPKNFSLVNTSSGPFEYFELRRGTRQIGNFTLQEMSGSNMLVSSGAWLEKVYQNKGIGRSLNQLRIEAAGTVPIICTVNNTNIPQIKVLLSNGWRKLADVDARSGLWMFKSKEVV